MTGYYCDDWRPNVVTATGATMKDRCYSGPMTVGEFRSRDWNSFRLGALLLIVSVGSLAFGLGAWIRSL